MTSHFDEHNVYRLQLPHGGTRTISREELEELSLNPAYPIPELHGSKTWISNYVGTFWIPFMGLETFGIYFQLVKMCFGEKEFAFPSIPYLSMITGKSENSVRKYIRKLQELNFVVVVQVIDSRNNRNTSNLYLLSNTIPFISTKQYEQLPKKLQEEHDKFLENIRKRKIVLENIPDYKSLD